MANITGTEIREVLRNLAGGTADAAVKEYCGLYVRVLSTLREGLSPGQIRATLFLNPKLARQAEASWIEEPRAADEVYRLVYSPEFNEARDVVRHTLERYVAGKLGVTGVYESGGWEHFEFFPTHEMLPRTEGETVQGAKERHFKAKSLPNLELLLQVAGVRDELAFLQLITCLDQGNMLLVEALLSGFKEEDLQAAGLGNYFLRKEKLRWIRAVRWGDFDPQPQIRRLVALAALRKQTGPILRQQTPGFYALLNRPSPDVLREYLEKTGLGADKLKPLYELVDQL